VHNAALQQCHHDDAHHVPPHPFTFLLSSDICAHGTAPGEGVAPPVRCAADPQLEALMPPHLCEDPPDEAGGVGLGPVHAAGKGGAKAVKCTVVDVHEPGGALLDMNAVPATTEDAPSIDLASGAEKATIAQPEALEPWAESEA